MPPFAGRLASPIAYHNCVVRADLAAEDADAAVEATVERFMGRNVPGSWHVGPSMRPADLPSRLEAHGLSGCSPDDAEPGMAIDLDSLPGDWPAVDQLAIRPVTGLSELDEFRQVLASGFGEGPLEADWVCEMYARIGLDPSRGWQHFVGRLGTEPVSTTSLFVADGVAGIYFVCTSPDYRARGIGAATTLAALHAAREMGLDLAILTSSPMGHRVYERLGFREYCRITVAEFDPRSERRWITP
jgi:GNAT superfamily N-acetyltransferase